MMLNYLRGGSDGQITWRIYKLCFGFHLLTGKSVYSLPNRLKTKHHGKTKWTLFRIDGEVERWDTVSCMAYDLCQMQVPSLKIKPLAE